MLARMPRALSLDLDAGQRIVSDPRRLSASVQAVQFAGLQVGAVGLLMPISYHTGFTNESLTQFGQQSRPARCAIIWFNNF